MHKFSIQTMPIVRDVFVAPKLKVYEILIQWAQYNKFVESGLKN